MSFHLIVAERAVRFTTALLGAISVMVAASNSLVYAQDYPERAITVVVPFAAGGTDAVSRVIGEKLSARLGKPVVIENKGGAGSMLGASVVARAAPDGYTLLTVTNSTIAVTPILYKVPLIDPLHDFVPLAMVSGSPFFLVVNSKLPINSVGDLVKLAKAKPKQLTYATAGVGSTAYMFMELFVRMAGIEMIHVPYKGTAQGMNDIMAGHVDMTFADPASAIAVLTSDRVKVLGISTKARHPAAPNVPSIAESGYPNFDVLAWIAMVAPGQTPAPVLQKLRTELAAVVNSADFKEFLIKNGSTVLDPLTPEQTTEFFKSEITRWGDILRASGQAGTQ